MKEKIEKLINGSLISLFTGFLCFFLGHKIFPKSGFYMLFESVFFPLLAIFNLNFIFIIFSIIFYIILCLLYSDFGFNSFVFSVSNIVFCYMLKKGTKNHDLDELFIDSILYTSLIRLLSIVIFSLKKINILFQLKHGLFVYISEVSNFFFYAYQIVEFLWSGVYVIFIILSLSGSDINRSVLFGTDLNLSKKFYFSGILGLVGAALFYKYQYYGLFVIFSAIFFIFISIITVLGEMMFFSSFLFTPFSLVGYYILRSCLTSESLFFTYFLMGLFHSMLYIKKKD